MSGRLFVVTLRRPRKCDQRTDPFWEFGSFGCTGCHRPNLMHPKNCQIRNEDRLAFVQGGHLGSRLLLVTPPVKRIDHPGGSPNGTIELRWHPGQKPFRYGRALSLFESPAPSRPGMFPRLANSVVHTKRPTMDAKFASRFRARARPLEPELASELESRFNAAVKRADNSDFISRYEDALPWCDCPNSVAERRRDYRRRLRQLEETGGSQKRKTGCSK